MEPEVGRKVGVDLCLVLSVNSFSPMRTKPLTRWSRVVASTIQHPLSLA